MRCQSPTFLSRVRLPPNKHTELQARNNRMILNKYQTFTEIENRGYSSTARIQNEDGSIFFAKWLKGIKKNSQKSKILNDKLRQLKKAVPQLVRASRAFHCWYHELRDYIHHQLMHPSKHTEIIILVLLWVLSGVTFTWAVAGNYKLFVGCSNVPDYRFVN